jgi:hypothetical protein
MRLPGREGRIGGYISGFSEIAAGRIASFLRVDNSTLHAKNGIQISNVNSSTLTTEHSSIYISKAEGSKDKPCVLTATGGNINWRGPYGERMQSKGGSIINAILTATKEDGVGGAINLGESSIHNSTITSGVFEGKKFTAHGDIFAGVVTGGLSSEGEPLTVLAGRNISVQRVGKAEDDKLSRARSTAGVKFIAREVTSGQEIDDDVRRRSEVEEKGWKVSPSQEQGR